MKRVSQLTALALLMGLAASTTCAAETMPALTLSHLQQQHGVAIDTRLSAYYNGWPQRANGPEGHEPQALNLSARWLGAMSDDQLRAWAKQHQLQSDTPIALYGSPEDNVSVAARLKQTGFTRLSTLSDALSQTDRLQKLPHFEQLVYPQWLHDLQQGKAVAAAPAGDWKVFEAAWGAPKLYLLSHIPGAGYIDTNEVESEPLWNKVSDAQLKAMLAKHGIRHDTTVILYGRDVYAAARVAQIMLYAGVKDVRLLDGGWQTWSDAGLPVERGMPPAQQPAPDFGAPIPGQPQLMLDTEQAAGCCIVRTPRWSASARGRSLSAPPAATAISSRRATSLAPAGATPGATPGTWRISITRTAPCAALTISLPCGASGTFCQASKWRSIAGPAGGPRKPLCMPAPWAGRTSRCTTAAGTNGAATRTIRWPAESAARKAVSNSPRLSASPFVGDARYPVYAVVVTRFKVW